ncbi:MAG: hypothetical protein M3O70_15435 [Actinomycetota bacterium]|nr:hypothetical protein [Actinomycetota bacterium]
MSVGADLLLVAAVAGVLVLGAWLWGQRVLLLTRRRRVTVRLKTGGHFHGVLERADAHHVLLKDAEALGVADRGTVRLGEVAIPRGNIDYVQVE